MCEGKSVIGSLEEKNRGLDAKERLAPVIAYKRLGWRPRVVGRILVVPRDATVRRVIEGHAATMREASIPVVGVRRAWLRQPSEPLRAIWFVSDGRHPSAVAG